MFERLLESGILVAVSPEIIFHRDTIEEARELIRGEIQANGQLVSSDFKDRVETTRKYAIPLLEHFDAEGLTVRDGAIRVLKDAKK